MEALGAREAFETVVIGGGQAGLAVGYHLADQGRSFVILDAHPRIGDAWRTRWDSLRTFTPASINGLPGMRFPAPRRSYPTKDEVADYLESYAARFELPVRTGTRVRRVWREDGRFIVDVGDTRLEAQNVVVAMSSFQVPRIPAFAKDLGEHILQLSARDYRNPSQLRDGDVLVVGAHDTGAEIALEAAGRHKTWLSGRKTGHLPFRIDGPFGRYIGVPLVMFMFHRVLKVSNPLGRKVRAKIHAHAGPVIRIRPKDLTAAGIERVPRVVGARGGRPLLEGGRTLDVANVVWCTGYGPDFSWIELPAAGASDVEPKHDRGIVPGEPGLYFVGLEFLSAASSSLLRGAGRDAERIVKAIASRTRAPNPDLGHVVIDRTSAEHRRAAR